MRFRQLVLFGALVTAASAASFGACLSGGARPAEDPAAPSVPHRWPVRDGAPEPSFAPDAPPGSPPRATDGGPSTQAAPGEPADAESPAPEGAVAPARGCESSRFVVQGPPRDGVVFNNAMTSADAGYVDRTALVLEALAQQAPRLGCCFDRAAVDELAATGSLLIVIELDPKGGVQSAFVERSRSGPLPGLVAGCVAAVVRAVDFPHSPAGRATRVEYPIGWRRTDG